MLDIRPSTHKVPHMRLCKLVVADIHPLHVLLGHPLQQVGHLVRPVVRLQDKRQEHVRSIG